MFAALNGTIVHNIQVGTAPHLARSVSNMRRSGGDIGDSFGSVIGSMAGCFNGGGAPLSDVGPGFWNDADSLEVSFAPSSPKTPSAKTPKTQPKPYTF